MKNALANKEETKKSEQFPAREESPFFYSLQQEMNRLFDEFRGTLGLAPPSKWLQQFGEFRAILDMKDTDEALLISADLPGVELKDIDISINEDTLCIKGEKRTEKEEKDKGYYRMERSYGSFHRLLPLPCSVDKDNVAATLKNGVLKITLPKTKESLKNEKKIVVKGA